MGLDERDVVGRLKEAGNKLLQPPASKDELLILLEEVELILKEVKHCPSKLVQEALLPAMKALIADSVIKNSDSYIRVIVAACFNEITRITAPDSPYDDNRMKEVFELIVASFDNLSLLSGRRYDKAVSIIDNVAKVRSCVMMLDLGCEKLIIKMLEQFQKSTRSNHPNSVFLAMETIMTLIINQSEDISLELLKVLLDCVSEEKENDLSMSWKLGSKVIENSAEKLKPYLRKALKSGHINKDAYGPIVESIFQSGSDCVVDNHVGDSAEQMVAKERAASATSPQDVAQSGNDAAKPVLSCQSEKINHDTSGTEKSSKALDPSKWIKSLMNAHSKAETEPEKEAKCVPSKRGRKPSSQDPKEGNKASLKKSSLSPRGHRMKNSFVASSKPLEIKSPASEGCVVKKESEVLSDSEEMNHQTVSVQRKKAGRPRKDAVKGSGNKVSETPHGKKKHKEDIVGCRIKVWWPMDKAYYEGHVASYDPSKMKHQVNYDDGDVEILNLMKEKFEFTADEDDGEASRKQPVSPSKEDCSATKDSALKKNGTRATPAGSVTPNENSNKASGSGRPSKSSDTKKRKLAQG